jgi:hypothetical protein
MIRTVLLAGASALAIGATPAAAAAAFDFTTPGLSTWTTPATGLYEIDVWGAQGGTNHTNSGGRGAEIGIKFNLTAGTALIIRVGAAGHFPGGAGASGGGGSSVIVPASGYFVLVGGGGGAGFAGSDGGPGQIGVTGQTGYGSATGAGGIGGAHFFGIGANGTTAGSGLGGNGGGLYSAMYGGIGGFNGGGGGGGSAGGGGGDGNNMNPLGGGGGGGGGASFWYGGVQQTVALSGVRFGGGEVLISTMAVPEPGTWSLMISGLGLLGYALRRRMRRLARA